MPEPSVVRRVSYRLFIGSTIVAALMGLVMVWWQEDMGKIWMKTFFTALIVDGASALLLAGCRTAQLLGRHDD